MTPATRREPRIHDPRLLVAVIVVVTAAKLATAAVMPMFYGDEPFYWLWSLHLAWGYYDHPPAIAAVIRAGTELFGKNEFGVRFFGIVLSVPTILMVWRSGSLLLSDKACGVVAALFFALTLQANVQALLAGPDAVVLPCAAAFTWALAEAIHSGDGRWWLAAGVFAGFGLLAKYTILCVGAGAFVWLLIAAEGRAWLRTPWPWLGGLLALAIATPNLLYNVGDNWNTFAFQFGRLGSGSLDWRYLPRFVLEQAVFASPLVLALALAGLWRASISRDQRQLLIAAMLWPTIAVFLLHGLFDRIHRAWTDILFPILAIAAAAAFRDGIGPRWLRAAAAPLAAVMIAVPYALVLSHAIPFERFDPYARQTATGKQEAVAPILRAIAASGAQAIVTSEYQTTAWLRFYLPTPALPVIQIDDEYRFAYAARPQPGQLTGTLLYVGRGDGALPLLRSLFAEVEDMNVRSDDGRFARYVYRLAGFKGPPAIGRMP